MPRWGAGAHYAGAHYDVNAYPYNPGLMMREAGHATALTGKWQITDFRVEPKALDAADFDDWCIWTGYEAGTLLSQA